ncbi:MAG: FGGY-family carbohydrate kinase [Deltaproteobacteria bacterium]|nr:FGGY-family carbohydrate kinase [Deltaproteobacteria bacterium]
MSYFIGHDVGTGASKAVLVDRAGTVLATSAATYSLSHPQPHWAEQDPADFWRAVTSCTRDVLSKSGVDPAEVQGICFSGQMLALVPLDRAGEPTRPAIGWMDNRAEDQARKLIRRLGGKRVLLALAGATPTGKDIVAKVAWIREHEPKVFAQTHGFCDATGYLVCRATGRILIDQTGAAGTGVVSRKTRSFSPLLAALVGFPLDKMPPVLRSTDIAGGLTPQAARECGLLPGTKVVMGMADIPAAAVGSGALEHGDGHLYLGTSSWLGVAVSRPVHVAKRGIVSVAAADPSMFLMIGESETAGACLEWFARYLGPGDGSQGDPSSLDALVGKAEPGSRQLLFLPWMFGERSPVPDTTVRAAFVNLSLEHRREHLVRAMYEGIGYNLRWILDSAKDVGLPCPALRVIGGGARSDAWLQILADVTNRRLDRVADPQHAGALGAALAAAVALGALPAMKAIKHVIPAQHSFLPQPGPRLIYDELYKEFRRLYPPMAEAGKRLNSSRFHGIHQAAAAWGA